MLQDKLHVLCSSVFPNLKSSQRNFKNLLNSSCFYLHFFFWKSSQPSFSVLFRKQKIDRKWYPSFFKNDSTCKLYVHNYINYFGLPRFSEHVWHSIFYLCRLPFSIPRLLQLDDLSFYLCFLFVSFIHRRCYYSLNYLCQNFGKSLLLTILEKKKFGFFVWSTLNLADFVEYH